MEADVKHLKDNPQTTLLEGLHSVAYSGGLGRPLIVPDGLLGGLNAGAAGRALAGSRGCLWGRAQAAGCRLGRQGQCPRQRGFNLLPTPSPHSPHPTPHSIADVAADFYAAHYTAPRMVLAAAGVPHDQLVRLAEPLLAGAPRGGSAGELPSKYMGGDWRCAALRCGLQPACLSKNKVGGAQMEAAELAACCRQPRACPPTPRLPGERRQFAASPLTHAILAFEYQGGWRDVKGSVAMTVLQYLLGGGGSFSAGASVLLLSVAAWRGGLHRSLALLVVLRAWQRAARRLVTPTPLCTHLPATHPPTPTQAARARACTRACTRAC